MTEQIMALLKKRGIAYPSFEIYGGLAGFYDYGPNGVRIKKNIEKLIRQHYIVEMGCMEVECNTLHPEAVFKASGHLESFSDVVTECEKCNTSYRADHLIMDETEKNLEGKPLKEIQLELEKISCPKCNSKLSKPFQYNMMFKTSVGPGKNSQNAYLRPETAQSTYLTFNRLWEYARKKLPFGVLQIGRSYRNEISPRQGMIRLREFSQSEIQFFFDPENLNWANLDEVKDIEITLIDLDEKTHETTFEKASSKLIPYQPIAYHLAKAVELFTKFGIKKEKLRLRQHRLDERSFYSKDTWDVEYQSDEFGWIELVGIAYRTNYDLNQHEKISGKKMTVSLDGKKFTPHVVEVAFGIDRPIYCLLESCLNEDGFTLPEEIAPYKYAILPLVKKDGLAEKAKEIHEKLTKQGKYALYDQGGSIGKRYARNDEIGTPYCITIDYDTMKDNTITLRDRKTKEQTRINLNQLP